MPLLTTEKFRPRPPSAAEQAEISTALGKRAANYALMDQILPVPEVRLPWRRRLAGPKAPVPIDSREADGRSARAWLQRDLRDPDGKISVMVEEVMDGRAVSDPQAKIGLDSQSNVYGDEFMGFTPTQDIDLMDGLQGTLLLLKYQASRVATREVPAAEATAGRFFGRMFSSLPS